MHTSFQIIAPLQFVSNTDFLSHIFRDIPRLETENPGVYYGAWVCSFPGDPAIDGNWRGTEWRPGWDIARTIDAAGLICNTFTTFASFTGQEQDNGVVHFPGRLKGKFGAAHAVMLDDIGEGLGAKIHPSQLAPISPTWMLETSPGNYQVGYLLRSPVLSGPLYGAFLDAMVHAGLKADADPGMKGVTRYGRLPVGVNGKEKYKALNGGASPFHRLVHWDLEAQYGLEELAQAYGMDWEAIQAAGDAIASGVRSGGLDRPVSSPQEGLWGQILSLATGKFDDAVDKGSDGIWHDIICPWVHEHTDGDDTGTAYVEGGGFKCHHGHCVDRDWQTVLSWLKGWGRVEGGRGQDEIARLTHQALVLEALELAGERPPPPIDVIVEPTAEELRTEIDGLDKGRPETAKEMLQRLAGLTTLDPLDEIEMIKRVADHSIYGIGEAKAAFKEYRMKASKEQAKEIREKASQAQQVKLLGGKWDVDHLGRVRLEVPQIEPGEWPDKRAPNQDGFVDPEPLPTLRNIEYLVQRHGGELRFNSMTKRREFLGTYKGWTGDYVDARIREAAFSNFMKLPNSMSWDALKALCEETRYHPFEDFLNTSGGAHKWDGTHRLPRLFGTIPVAPGREDLRDRIIERWLMSVVAAARHIYKDQPGWQPRGVLVFVGSQNAGKSTWLARLFAGLFPGSDDCFRGGMHFDNTRDAVAAVTGALVTELGEIDSTMNRSEEGMLKAFLSSIEETYRKAYDKEEQTHARRTVFAGTVNRPDYLRDPTGSTRFWTIETTGAFDLDSQREMDMIQIWAEVDAICAAKMSQNPILAPWLLDSDEIKEVEINNAKHRSISEGEQALLDTYDFEHAEWLATGIYDDRRRGFNPMTMVEIRRECEIRMPGPMLTGLLIRLTGQPSPSTTTITHRDGRRQKGRFWFMPPRLETTPPTPPD